MGDIFDLNGWDLVVLLGITLTVIFMAADVVVLSNMRSTEPPCGGHENCISDAYSIPGIIIAALMVGTYVFILGRREMVSE